MASSVWKGFVSFGLVSVPVRLFAAARESHVSFNQVHAVCGTRTRQQLFCPTCDRVVERSEIAKGYPLGNDRYVLVTPEELKTLEAESSDNMNILQFVKLSEVDPLYYQTSYYTAPEDSGRRAYALLMKGMQELQVAAIAKVTMHQREQVVLIRPYDRGLVLHTLYYPEEVREVPEYGSQGQIELQGQEVELAEQFIQRLIANFDPSQFKDEYQAKVQGLIESKEAGMSPSVKEQPARKRGQVIDLMEALKKSMQIHEAEAPAKKGPQTVKKPSKSAAANGKKKVG
jgi:DNA end-binding protein Ku